MSLIKTNLMKQASAFGLREKNAFVLRVRACSKNVKCRLSYFSGHLDQSDF